MRRYLYGVYALINDICFIFMTERLVASFMDYMNESGKWMMYVCVCETDLVLFVVSLRVSMGRILDIHQLDNSQHHSPSSFAESIRRQSV